MRRTTIATVSAAVLASGLLAASASTQASGQHQQVAAPSGQTTVGGLLPTNALRFAQAATGWSAFGKSQVRQVGGVGHTAVGALAVASGGKWMGAASPRFAVRPGARYTASTWVLARSASQSVGIGLRFFDVHGNQISAGNQIGQGLPSSTKQWTSTMPVVGFAPADAATGQVVFLDFSGAAGDVQFLDDLRLSRTTGAAAPLAVPLHTRGNRILDRHGRVVTLRGVMIDGLQYTQWSQVSPRDIDEAHVWGANFVRIALGEDFVLPSACGYDRARYISRVDGLVAEATRLHMISLLDLHTNALVPCSKPLRQRMPDQRSIEFWKTMANRYKSNPYVAFDLYNEPHDVTDRVWRYGGAVTSSGVTYVAPGMQRLYNTVRGTGATNLVFISGNNFASTFPATAPLPHTTNVVYGVHAYTCSDGTPSSGATCQPGPKGIFDPNGVLDRFTSAARRVPLVVTEFGYPDTNEGRYNANVTASVTARRWSGWCVFAFTGNTTGWWNLVKDTSALNDPSIAGMAVVNALR